MDKKQNNRMRNGGLGFVSTFTLILFVLKIFNLISISWLWVLSPIWISLSLVVIAFISILILGRVKKGKW